MSGRMNAAWSNKSCHVGISHVIRAKNPRKEDVVGIVISMNNDNMAICGGSCLPGSEYEM